MSPRALLILSLLPLIAIASPVSYSDTRTVTVNDLSNVVGDRRVDAYLPNIKLVDVVSEFLGLRNADVIIDENRRQISGCRLHSCDEKAMAIIDIRQARVEAIALRIFDCHFVPAAPSIPAIPLSGRHPVKCPSEPIYQIYAIRDGISSAALEKEAGNILRLQDWISSLGGHDPKIQVLIRP